MFTPENELGVIVLFGMQAQALGWQVKMMQATYPDAILLDSQNQEWITEFEFLASNFLAHAHDHRACDLIVCWINDYKACPLPILELQSGILSKKPKATEAEKAAEYWMQRCLRTERAARANKQAAKQLQVISEKLSADSRQNMIVKILQRDGDIGPVAMGEKLGVDRTTIHRDLQTLKKAKLVHKNSHGWAVGEA